MCSNIIRNPNVADNIEQSCQMDEAKQSALLLKQKICKTNNLIKQYSENMKDLERTKSDLETVRREAKHTISNYKSSMDKIRELELKMLENKQINDTLTTKINEYKIKIAADDQIKEQLSCKIKDLENRYSIKVKEYDLQKSTFEGKIKDLEHEIKLKKSKVTSPKKKEKKQNSVDLDAVKTDINKKSTSDIGINVSLCDNKVNIKYQVEDKNIMTDEFYNIKDDPYPLFCAKCEAHLPTDLTPEKICKTMSICPELIEKDLSPCSKKFSSNSLSTTCPNYANSPSRISTSYLSPHSSYDDLVVESANEKFQSKQLSGMTQIGIFPSSQNKNHTREDSYLDLLTEHTLSIKKMERKIQLLKSKMKKCRRFKKKLNKKKSYCHCNTSSNDNILLNANLISLICKSVAEYYDEQREPCGNKEQDINSEKYAYGTKKQFCRHDVCKSKIENSAEEHHALDTYCETKDVKCSSSDINTTTSFNSIDYPSNKDNLETTNVEKQTKRKVAFLPNEEHSINRVDEEKQMEKNIFSNEKHSIDCIDDSNAKEDEIKKQDTFKGTSKDNVRSRLLKNLRNLKRRNKDSRINKQENTESHSTCNSEYIKISKKRIENGEECDDLSLKNTVNLKRRLETRTEFEKKQKDNNLSSNDYEKPLKKLRVAHIPKVSVSQSSINGDNFTHNTTKDVSTSSKTHAMNIESKSNVLCKDVKDENISTTIKLKTIDFSKSITLTTDLEHSFEALKNIDYDNAKITKNMISNDNQSKLSKISQNKSHNGDIHKANKIIETIRSSSSEISQTIRSSSPKIIEIIRSPSPKIIEAIRSPSPKIIETIRSPSPEMIETRSSLRINETIRSPSPRIIETIRSPSPKIIETIRSPSPTTLETIRSPSPKIIETIRSPSPRIIETIRSPSPEMIETSSLRINETIRSPSPKIIETIRSPSPKIIETIRSPSPEMIETRNSLRINETIRSPSPRIIETIRSPSPTTLETIRSPSPRDSNIINEYNLNDMNNSLSYEIKNASEQEKCFNNKIINERIFQTTNKNTDNESNVNKKKKETISLIDTSHRKDKEPSDCQTPMSQLMEYTNQKHKNKIPQKQINYICCLTDKFIKKQLQKVVNSNWEEIAYDDILEKLGNTCGPRVIAKCVVTFLLEQINHNEPLDKSFTPPAPMMTSSEQKIVTLLINLEKLKPTVIFFVQAGIEYNLFRLNKEAKNLRSNQVSSLTRIYIALSRIQKNREKVRILCCDALYTLNFKSIDVLYTILTCWAEVFPNAETNTELLPKCIAFLINLQKIEDPHTNELKQLAQKLNTLKYYVSKFYKYTYTQETISSIIKELMTALQTKRIDGLDTAIILIAKKEGTSWTYTNIIESSLLPMIIENKHPCIYSAFSLLGKLLRAFPVEDKDNVVQKITEQLCDLINSGQGSHDQQEGVVSALLNLNRHEFKVVASTVIKWVPNKPLRPTTQIQLQAFIKTHNAKFWRNYLKSHK